MYSKPPFSFIFLPPQRAHTSTWKRDSWKYRLCIVDDRVSDPYSFFTDPDPDPDPEDPDVGQYGSRLFPLYIRSLTVSFHNEAYYQVTPCSSVSEKK
jgi:hypothetical protein